MPPVAWPADPAFQAKLGAVGRLAQTCDGGAPWCAFVQLVSAAGLAEAMASSLVAPISLPVMASGPGHSLGCRRDPRLPV